MHHDRADTTPPISQAKLLEHLSLSKSSAHLIAKAGVEPIGGKYPWRRIWRAVHGIEGAHLAGHLVVLKARHPDSPILEQTADLEDALKTPLWDFPRLAHEMGWSYDTYRKAIKERRATLPAPVIELGGRKKMFRPLEVILMRDEGIALDLPKASNFAAKTKPAATSTSTPAPKGPTSAPSSTPAKLAPNTATDSEPNTRKKVVFGAFAGAKRSSVG